MRKILSFLPFLILLLYLCGGGALAQAPSGYTKIASTSATTTTYTDTAVTSGQVNNYVVVAFNAAGDSTPSNIITLITPSTPSTACGTGNTHCNVLNWLPSVPNAQFPIPATGYSVYKQLVTPPNPPGAVTGTAN